MIYMLSYSVFNQVAERIAYHSFWTSQKGVVLMVYKVLTICISAARLVIELIKLYIEHKKSRPVSGK
jgi:hypothetical protein